MLLKKIDWPCIGNWVGTNDQTYHLQSFKDQKSGRPYHNHFVVQPVVAIFDRYFSIVADTVVRITQFATPEGSMRFRP